MAPRAKPAPPIPRARRAAHEVRIIGGQWKRTQAAGARQAGPAAHARPRARDPVQLARARTSRGWHCVDAFAGTGALGLEAASRGAADVLLVEQDAALVDQLRAIQAKLGASGVKVERGQRR